MPPRRTGRLNFDDLPEEFTPEVYGSLRVSDLIELESRVEDGSLELTERQRESYEARRAEESAKIRAKFGKALDKSESVARLFGRTDKLGERIRQSTAATQDLVQAPRIPRFEYPDAIERVHQERASAVAEAAAREEARWDRLNALTESVAESTALLAERTEQQHREAGRQRVETGLLAYVALLATAAALVDIGLTSALWAGLATLLIFAAVIVWRRRRRTEP